MDHVIAPALEFLLVFTGRLAIEVFSFGRWRSESLDGGEGKVHGASGALSFVRDGRRVVTPTGQLFAGIASCVLLAAVAIGYAATF